MTNKKNKNFSCKNLLNTAKKIIVNVFLFFFLLVSFEIKWVPKFAVFETGIYKFEYTESNFICLLICLYIYIYIYIYIN